MGYSARVVEGEAAVFCNFCNARDQYFERYEQREPIGTPMEIHVMVLVCGECGRELDRRRISEPPVHLDESGKWEAER